MRKKTYVVILALIGSLLALPSSSAAAPAVGKTCSTLGKTQLHKSKQYTCVKSGKRLIWSKPVALGPVAPKPKPTPTPTPSATPTPTPSVTPISNGVIPPPTKGINLYTGGPGGIDASEEISFELPLAVQAAPAGANVKLWIYNPANKKAAAGSSGLFIQSNAGEWKFYPANADGSFYLALSTGTHLFGFIASII